MFPSDKNIFNRLLYWSEQGQPPKYPSTVEMSDLSGKRHQVLEEHQDNEYYQVGVGNICVTILFF